MSEETKTENTQGNGDLAVVMHWVATSERLPDFETPVLCYNDKEPLEPLFIQELNSVERTKSGEHPNWSGTNKRVSHWSTLPKPPCA